jgi:hypothetical protein
MAAAGGKLNLGWSKRRLGEEAAPAAREENARRAAADSPVEPVRARGRAQTVDERPAAARSKSAGKGGARAQPQPQPQPQPAPPAAPEPAALGRPRSTTADSRAAAAPAPLLRARSAAGKSKMSAEDRRRLSLVRREFAREELRVLTEEAAEWVASTLGADYGDALFAGFWERIATGVDLCRLVPLVSPPNALVPCRFNDRAAPRSFHARDNVANFIAAIRTLGVPPICLFEADDVVLRRNEKNVVNCLLMLAKVATRNGVKPPLIVQYELEIDAMVAARGGREEDDEDDDEEEEEEEDEDAPREPQGPRYLPYTPKAGDAMDEAMAKVLNQHGLDIRVRRCKAPGEYRIGKGPKCFIRLIRHLLLVRVGGGWENIATFVRRKLAGEGLDEDAAAAAAAAPVEAFRGQQQGAQDDQMVRFGVARSGTAVSLTSLGAPGGGGGGKA